MHGIKTVHVEAACEICCHTVSTSIFCITEFEFICHITNTAALAIFRRDSMTKWGL